MWRAVLLQANHPSRSGSWVGWDWCILYHPHIQPGDNFHIFTDHELNPTPTSTSPTPASSASPPAGFYAYATFDISDLTTFRAANCACILATQGLRAPIMSEVIYGKDWLAAAATVLQLQVRR